MQTVKHLLKNAEDPYLALLSYRATPLPWCGRSPAELLMGRNIRSTLPQTTESLTPQWPYLREFKRLDKEFKEKQKADYDRRHRVRDLQAIPDHTDVWVTTDSHRTSGRVVTSAGTPRSYIIETPSGEIRRNRSHLNINPARAETSTSTQQDRSPIMTRSRTGASIIPPDRLA